MKKQLLLNRNEMTVGPAPACLKTLRNFKPSHAAQYLPGYYTSILIPKLAKKHHVPEEQIILSYGSEDFLRTVFNHLDPTRDCILTHTYHYIYYDRYAKERGFNIIQFGLEDKNNHFEFNVADCLKKYRQYRPKSIVITSPNNPTGNSLKPLELESILKKISQKTLVVIDGAYAGLALKNDDEKILHLVHTYPNLAITRTFSKLYALAGMRIAYVVVGKNVKKLLGYQPYYLGFSRILEEVAVRALEATDYYRQLRELLIKDRTFFITEVNKLHHFTAYPSDATFVLIKPDTAVRAVFKKTIMEASFNLVRPINEELYRVSLDPKKYTKKFVDLLSRIDRKI
jgi:histidinol-phosphate aminotransferase